MPNKKPTISIEVYQEDWIPGFAAYASGSLAKNARAHVMLNVSAFLSAVESKDIPKEEIPYFVAESLMHEVIHVLEDWAGVEFSEEKVEALIAKYKEKYRKEKLSTTF